MSSVLLMGHGSPSRAAQIELLELRGLLQGALGRQVALGVLEFAAPGLPALAQAFGDLEPGAPVAAQPLLLFDGLHGRHDMPREAASAAARFGLKVRLGSPIGAEPALIEQAVRRIAQHPSRAGDVLVFVGRGSSLASALEQTQSVGAWIAREAGLAHVVCHAGISSPDPAAGVALAAPGARRVLVLPWLIHTGLLLERVRTSTEAAARELGLDVVQLPHIGNGPELVDVMSKRIEALL